MKLAIIGSRDFNDYDMLVDFLWRYKDSENIDSIISGGAKGADLLGKKCAKDIGFHYVEFLPDWEKYGKAAGFIRNSQIVDACDEVIAFWDGKSRGTQDTITKAKKAKKPTFIVYF